MGVKFANGFISLLTCSAKRANTIRQNIVSVMTSASCRNECNNALMMVFKPGVREWEEKTRQVALVIKLRSKGLPALSSASLGNSLTRLVHSALPLGLCGGGGYNIRNRNRDKWEHS